MSNSSSDSEFSFRGANVIDSISSWSPANNQRSSPLSMPTNQVVPTEVALSSVGSGTGSQGRRSTVSTVESFDAPDSSSFTGDSPSSLEHTFQLQMTGAPPAPHGIDTTSSLEPIIRIVPLIPGQGPPPSSQTDTGTDTGTTSSTDSASTSSSSAAPSGSRRIRADPNWPVLTDPRRNVVTGGPFVPITEKTENGDRRFKTMMEVPRFEGGPGKKEVYVKYGPIVGAVTDRSARVMVVLDRNVEEVTMWAVDYQAMMDYVNHRPIEQMGDMCKSMRGDSRDQEIHARPFCAEQKIANLRKDQPVVFFFQNLKPGRTYLIRMNVRVPRLAAVSFRTLPPTRSKDRTAYPAGSTAFVFSGEQIMYQNAELQKTKHSKDLWEDLYRKVMRRDVGVVVHVRNVAASQANLRRTLEAIEGVAIECRLEDATDFIPKKHMASQESTFRRHVLANASNIFW